MTVNENDHVSDIKVFAKRFYGSYVNFRLASSKFHYDYIPSWHSASLNHLHIYL